MLRKHAKCFSFLLSLLAIDCTKDGNLDSNFLKILDRIYLSILITILELIIPRKPIFKMITQRLPYGTLMRVEMLL